MSENQEQLVFRCGWTWWRVLAVVGSWLVVAVFGAMIVIVLGMLWQATFAARLRDWPAEPLSAKSIWTVLLCVAMCVGFIVVSVWDLRATYHRVRNWRAEVGADKLRIADKRGDPHELAWHDMYTLAFLWLPQLRTAQGKIGFPGGIIGGRRLFALIAERAGLTERKGSWITGVTLSRPTEERD